MALPADFQTCRVTAHYVDLLGQPVAGSVKFIATPNRIVSPATTTIVVPAPRIVDLDGGGELDVNIPATDDPDISPQGFTYRVIENLSSGGGLIYNIEAPVGQTIDLSTVVTVNPGTGVAVTKGDPGEPGEPGPPLQPLGTVATVLDLPVGGDPGDMWIVDDTGHAWSWTGAAWTDLGMVTLTNLDETGSAPSLGLAESSIDKVEDGDLFMAAGGVVNRVVGGQTRGFMESGVIRTASGLHVAATYNQTAKPGEPAVGTFVNVEWNATMDDPGGFGPEAQTGYYGPRPAINLEGHVRYARHQTQYAFSPVGFGDFLAVGNTAGVARNIVPSWPFLCGRLYFADGATVTHVPTDVSNGGAAFVDATTFSTFNGGHWDGTTNDSEIISFFSFPWAVGDGTFARRIGFEAGDINDPDHSTGLSGTRGAMEAVHGAPIDPQNWTTQHNIGFRSQRLNNGVHNIGFWNAAGRVDEPAAVTITSSVTLPRNVARIHAATPTGTAVEVTSTPIIPDGLPGQIIDVVNVGAGSFELRGELAGAAKPALAGTNLSHTVVLPPGDTVRYEWDPTASRWALRNHSNARVQTSAGTLNLYGGDHRYQQVGIGTYFGLAYAGFGPGGATEMDTWFTRTGAGTLALGSSINQSGGTIVAAYQRAINATRRAVYGPNGLSVSPVGNADDTQPTATFGDLAGTGFVAFGSGSAGPDVWLSRAGAGVAQLGQGAGGSTGTLALGRLRLNSYANVAAIPNPHVVGDLAVVAGTVQVCTTAGSPGTWTVVGSQS